MIHLMLKYIPYRISLNKVIIISNQANIYMDSNYKLSLCAKVRPNRGISKPHFLCANKCKLRVLFS